MPEEYMRIRGHAGLKTFRKECRNFRRHSERSIILDQKIRSLQYRMNHVHASRISGIKITSGDRSLIFPYELMQERDGYACEKEYHDGMMQWIRKCIANVQRADLRPYIAMIYIGRLRPSEAADILGVTVQTVSWEIGQQLAQAVDESMMQEYLELQKKCPANQA